MVVEEEAETFGPGALTLEKGEEEEGKRLPFRDDNGKGEEDEDEEEEGGGAGDIDIPLFLFLSARSKKRARAFFSR